MSGGVFRVGGWTIERVVELELEEPAALFPDLEEPAAVFPSIIASWVLRRPGRCIVIDTGCGNGKERPASPRFGGLALPFLERLGAIGVVPEAVDLVINTHLHVDHVGWNTRLDGGAWVPTFPRARYLLPAAEVAARDPARGGAGKPEGALMPFRDSVQPVLAAGVATLMDGTETVEPGVDLLPVPGHAPGQMAVRVRDAGAEALFIADVMHQPVQVARPDWNSRYCEEPALARRTRLAVLRDAAAAGSLLLPGHFGGSGAGFVLADGDGFVFRLG